MTWRTSTFLWCYTTKTTKDHQEKVTASNLGLPASSHRRPDIFAANFVLSFTREKERKWRRIWRQRSKHTRQKDKIKFRGRRCCYYRSLLLFLQTPLFFFLFFVCRYQSASGVWAYRKTEKRETARGTFTFARTLSHTISFWYAFTICLLRFPRCCRHHKPRLAAAAAVAVSISNNRRRKGWFSHSLRSLFCRRVFLVSPLSLSLSPHPQCPKLCFAADPERERKRETTETRKYIFEGHYQQLVQNMMGISFSLLLHPVGRLEGERVGWRKEASSLFP